jgi:hypothetical protein
MRRDRRRRVGSDLLDDNVVGMAIDSDPELPVHGVAPVGRNL